MEFTAENILLLGSILLFASIIAGKAGYRFGLPALLLFLGVGMLFGVDGFGIHFNNPGLTQFIGVAALSVILFSGGMDTKIGEVHPIMGRGLALSTLGVVLTTFFTGGFIYIVTNLTNFTTFSLAESFLIGAIVSSTDSASVFSILRSKRQGLKHRIRPLLEFESGSNDPMAYMLMILILQIISTGEFSVWGIIKLLVLQISVGAFAGWLLGRLGLLIMRRLNMDNKSLYSVLLLSFVFFIFSFTNLIHGNGYLAVYVAGLTIGNGKFSNRRTISAFFDGFAWLFQIVIFLTLGLLVNPRELLDIWLLGLVIALFLTFMARPAMVFLTLWPWGKKISTKCKIFISWVGLRGAVPIIFATYPLIAGIENSHNIFNIVFFITIVSLGLQGTTVGWLARKLGLGIKEKAPTFDIDLPEDIKASLTEVEVTEMLLSSGSMIKQIDIPKTSRIVMVKRDAQFFVPRGSTKLSLGDKLLIISDDKDNVHPSPDKEAHPLV